MRTGVLEGELVVDTALELDYLVEFGSKLYYLFKWIKWNNN